VNTAGRLPKLDSLDRRIAAFRPELADTRLKGEVKAERFVLGEPGHVVEPVIDLRPAPNPDSGIDHQLLLGEQITIFDRAAGWAWVQSQTSRYVGWVPEPAIATGTFTATHRIAARRTFIYPEPDLKLPVARSLSIGSHIAASGEAEARGQRYLLLEGGGAVVARHTFPADVFEQDYVTVAERLLGTPYLWGGSSGDGVDCSGLVYLAMLSCGRKVLRDSDMMAATLGEEIDPGPGHSGLKRGDLVFWRGHVAIVEGDGNLLHANGYTMDVTSEPLDQALERIATLFEEPIGYRRP